MEESSYQKVDKKMTVAKYSAQSTNAHPYPS